MTLAIILGVPEAMKTVVSVSSYARTASGSRPYASGAAFACRASRLRRRARCSLARCASSGR